MPSQQGLKADLARFRAPILSQSLFQIVTSLGGFLAASAAMYLLLPISYWLALPLIPIAAGFLVRVFIIQHDCGHFAFFRSRRANNAVGFLCSLFTLTPYLSWRRQHAGHHGIWNDLDRRQSGADIYSTCLTVAEYRAMGPWQQRWFRLTRHPFVTNLLLPPVVFLLVYRIPFDMPKAWRRERRAVQWTNAAIAALVIGVGFLVGFEALLLVQLPIMIAASIIGVWLFSVQHRGENVRWAGSGEWNATRAALESSTFLRLPPFLRWFTGNIGFHHVHHLEPRVPNYRLRACHESHQHLRQVRALSIGDAFRSMRFLLWDGEAQAMIRAR
jgi:acyl-lipid omega-6 desaturase (Delta-12 desaturase)